MGAITYDIKIPSSILFKSIILDANTLIPKIMPQAIKSVEILEGDGGAKAVKIDYPFWEGNQNKSVASY
ncbi:UNVERIFIED_CONTAM: putative intracellular pathogenesis-related protein T1 [Sesamum indicum]